MQSFAQLAVQVVLQVLVQFPKQVLLHDPWQVPLQVAVQSFAQFARQVPTHPPPQLPVQLVQDVLQPLEQSPVHCPPHPVAVAVSGILLSVLTVAAACASPDAATWSPRSGVVVLP